MTHLEFTNARGETLVGRLDLPIDGEPRAFALFAHCFTCGKDLRSARIIARELARAGIATLRFDFAGLGASEGDFGATTFSHDVDDLVAAAEVLAERYRAPRLLIGHSLGGAAALKAAGRIDSIDAVATIGAPSSPAHVERLLEGARGEIAAEGEACVVVAGREFRVRKAFLDDLLEHDLEADVEALQRALLVLHAPFDDVVGVDNAAAIFRAAKHPKSYVSLDEADHLLSEPAAAAWAGAVIAQWAERYLGTEDPADWRDRVHANRVVVRTEEGLRTEAMVAGFGRIFDEPTSLGGTGTGPTPYDALSAALATCTSMTLRMYADRKGWPLDAVQVDVDHAKVHVDDCRDCPDAKGAKIDRFECSIRIEGDLDAAQRARLLEIADRCPVHRTLEGEVRIQTELVD